MLKDGFEEKEIAEAKSGWLQSRQVTRAQDASLARSLAADLYLKRTLAWDADLEKKVGALTAAQIQAAMRKFLDPAKMTIVKAGDFAKCGKGGRSGPMTKSSAQGAWALALAVTVATPAATPPTAKKATHMQTLHGDSSRTTTSGCARGRTRRSRRTSRTRTPTPTPS